MDSRFPDKRWFEYSWAKKNNPELIYDQWQPWDEWTYSQADQERFAKIILDNIDMIAEKKVFDVGTLVGTLALFCLYNKSSHVTSIDVRTENLDIAREGCDLAGFSNVDFILCDLYDSEKLLAMIGDSETILLSGVFYHVNNHYQLIEQLSSSQAQNLILETVINDSTNSTVEWFLEDSTDHRAGADGTRKTVLAGCPSKRYCTDLLKYHGWTIKQTATFFYQPDSNDEPHTRCVISAYRTLS
jgi:predicted nicotinamide N-methyase